MPVSRDEKATTTKLSVDRCITALRYARGESMKAYASRLNWPTVWIVDFESARRQVAPALMLVLAAESITLGQLDIYDFLMAEAHKKLGLPAGFSVVLERNHQAGCKKERPKVVRTASLKSEIGGD
jgi:hypothetical protein